MATYQEIINKINGITDNGNNTAAEVRSVLTDMLNYGNEGFEIASPDLIDSNTMMYHYSFKGIKKQCCNLYFLFSLKEKTTATDSNGLTSLFLDVSDEDFETLKSFIPVLEYGDGITNYSGYLAYTAPTLPTGVVRYLNLVLLIMKGKKSIFISTNANLGETIMTAVAVNFKSFKLPGANARNKKDSEMFSKAFNLNINPDIIK